MTKEKKLKVLVVRPHKYPVVEEIENKLETFQELVDGYIQVIYPWEDKVSLVCNDEGKIMGMDLNRELKDEDGNTYEIIAGTFFICGIKGSGFCSLTDEQIKKYTEIFREPFENSPRYGMN